MAAKIDLVRSPHLQPAVRPMAVVPLDEQGQLIPEHAVVVGHKQPPCALVLDRANEPFDRVGKSGQEQPICLGLVFMDLSAEQDEDAEWCAGPRVP